MENNNEKVYLTLEGLKKIKGDYDTLVSVERPRAAKRIELALADGGSDDNVQYETAIEESLVLEGKIKDLEENLKKAVLIDEEGGNGEVKLGSKVVVESNGEKMEFVVVGSAEADPLNGKISNESPVGQKLIGAKKGQLIEIREREVTYKVMEVN